MLPIKNNNDQSACDPVSSNCVIWQGPDIPCIDLCHGDSISDVTAKLAAELCDVLNLVDITQYDISCFSPVCPAFTDFSDLVQFIIDKLCELQTCCNTETPTTSGCPECILTIAACFQYVNELGDTITTMNIDDYVRAIGNKVCQLESTITALQSTVANHESRITYIENNCCNTTPGTEIITIPDSCLDPSLSNIPIDDFVQNLEDAFCNLQNNTGTPSQILANISPKCFATQAPDSLINPGSLPANYNSNNYATMAGSLANAWAMICDIYAAVQNIQNTCCAVTCDDVDIIFQSITTSSSNILITTIGNIPVGFSECGSGSTINIIDAYGTNATATWNYDLTGTPVSIAIPPSLESSIKYTVTATACSTDGNITCNETATQVINGNITCTSLSLAITDDTDGTATVNFTMPAVSTPISYTLIAVATNGITFSENGTNAGGLVSWATGAFLSSSDSVSVTVTLIIQQNGQSLTYPCQTTGTVTYP